MPALIGSKKGGIPSELAGNGSVLTGAGVCPPLPRQWIADGASVKAGTEGVLTAGEMVCGPSGCGAGQTYWSTTFAGPFAIASSGIGAPTRGVLVLPVGNLPNCANLRLAVSAQLAWTGVVGASASAAHAYLSPNGLNDVGRSFSNFGTYVGSQIANIPAITSDLLYHSYTFVVYPGGSPAYNDFSGPLTGYSLYIWPPVLAPSFDEGFWNIKNVVASIVTF